MLKQVGPYSVVRPGFVVRPGMMDYFRFNIPDAWMEPARMVAS